MSPSSRSFISRSLSPAPSTSTVCLRIGRQNGQRFRRHPYVIAGARRRVDFVSVLAAKISAEDPCVRLRQRDWICAARFPASKSKRNLSSSFKHFQFEWMRPPRCGSLIQTTLGSFGGFGPAVGAGDAEIDEQL